MRKHFCWSHFLTMLQVSIPETSLKKTLAQVSSCEFSAIFQKTLFRTSSWDDCYCLFLCSNQSFIHWSLCLFFPSLFSFIIDNCNHGSLLRKYLKIKTFLLFTIVCSNININVIKTICLSNICQCTLEKIQISFTKSLSNCRVLRRISKAVSCHQINENISSGSMAWQVTQHQWFSIPKNLGVDFFLKQNECSYFAGFERAEVFLHCWKENKNRMLRNFCMFFHN